MTTSLAIFRAAWCTGFPPAVTTWSVVKDDSREKESRQAISGTDQDGHPGLGPWEEPSTWAHGYGACRRAGISTEAIRSRSRSFPRSLYDALDDILFDERVERAVARALNAHDSGGGRASHNGPAEIA